MGSSVGKADLLGGPHERRLFRYCREVVRMAGTDGASPDSLLNIDPASHFTTSPRASTEEKLVAAQQAEIARLHLKTARLVINHRSQFNGRFSSAAASKELADLAAKFQLPTIPAQTNLHEVTLPATVPVPAGQAMDLAEEMVSPGELLQNPAGHWRGSLRPHLSSTSFPVLFVREGKEFLGWMTLELIEQGTGCLYPSPELLFLPCDQHWRAMERDVPLALRHLGLWKESADIRWRLQVKSPSDAAQPFAQLRIPLAGPSAGAIVALGCASLLARRFGSPENATREAWLELDVTQTTFTAGIRRDGTLFRVAGVDVKLAGAARSHNLIARIGTVGLAGDNFDTVAAEFAQTATDSRPLEKVEGSPHFLKEKEFEFYLLSAPTLEDAVRRLSVLRLLRKLPFSPPLESLHRLFSFVPRPEVAEHLAAFIRHAAASSGVLAYVAVAGFGKTQWLCHYVRDLQAAGLQPVYYAIGYHSGTERDAIARSLHGQLRLKYLLPATDLPDGDPLRLDGRWTERFRQVLQTVSARRTPEDPEILYIEAADQVGEMQHLVAELFNPRLAPNVWCVITTRPDIRWLDAPEGVMFVDFATLQPLDRGELERLATTPPAAATGYRRAVRDFVEQANLRLDPPLRTEFIDAIFASSNHSPIFGAVDQTLRLLFEHQEKLAKKLPFDPAQAARIESFRTSIEPWLESWEERTCGDVMRMEESAARRFGDVPDPVRLVWTALGLVDILTASKETYRKENAGPTLAEMERLLSRAVFVPDDSLEDPGDRVEEQQTAAQLNALKMQLTQHLGACLDLAVNFFRYRPAFRGESPYAFAHPAYVRLVRGHIHPHPALPTAHPGAWEDCHSLLGSACARLLLKDGRYSPDSSAPQEVTEFASRRVLTHLSRSRLRFAWRQFEALVSEFANLEARWKAGQFYELLGDWRDALTWHPDERGAAKKKEEWLVDYFAWLKAIRERPVGTPGPPVPTAPGSPQRIQKQNGGFSQYERLHLWFQFLSGSLPTLQFWEAHQTLPRPDFRVLAYNSASNGPVHDAGEEALANPHAAHGPLVDASGFTDKPALLSSFLGLAEPQPALRQLLIGHTKTISGVALNADGSIAVTGSFDDTVRVWDTATGRHRVLGAHLGVRAVALSADGRVAISESADRSVWVWDLDSNRGRVLEDYEQGIRRGEVTSLAMSADGRTAVSGGGAGTADAGTVDFWNLENGKYLRATSDTGHVRSLALSADGRTAASSSFYDSDPIRVWDTQTGECRRVIEESENKAVALSADGSLLVCGGYRGEVHVWDAVSGLLIRVLEGQKGWRIGSVALSADGRVVVAFSADRKLRVWDVQSGRCLRVHDCHGVHHFLVALSADGRTAVSAGDDTTLRVWDIMRDPRPDAPPTHRKPVQSVAISANGRTAVSSGDNTVRLWDVERGQCLRLIVPDMDAGAINWAIVSADGSTIVSYYGDVWDVTTGETRPHLRGGSCCQYALSADGRTAVYGGTDNLVRVWDVENGECRHAFTGHEATVSAIAMSADGRTAVSGSEDKSVRVWDLEKGKCLKALQGHKGSVLAVALSSDGNTVVSGGEDYAVRIWDLGTGRCTVLEGHQGWVCYVALSADGRKAISGAKDGVRVWDVASGQCHIITINLAFFVCAKRNTDGRWMVDCTRKRWFALVALSSDGRTVVTGAEDNTVRLWDVESGKCLAWHHAGNAVLSVACALRQPEEGLCGAGSEQQTLEIVYGTDCGDVKFLTLKR